MIEDERELFDKAIAGRPDGLFFLVNDLFSIVGSHLGVLFRANDVHWKLLSVAVVARALFRPSTLADVSGKL